jgi:hypothetical protein
LRRLFETNFFRRSVRPYRPPQSAFPSDLRIGAFLEALCYDPCLLFRRSPPPPLSGDQLDTTIRTAFLPGICHRFTPTDHLMPSCTQTKLTTARVGASYRLLMIYILVVYLSSREKSIRKQNTTAPGAVP